MGITSADEKGEAHLDDWDVNIDRELGEVVSYVWFSWMV